MRQTTPPRLTPQIVMLADRLEFSAALADWFRRQWPRHYAERSAADIEQDFRREANRTVLPIRLVAIHGGALAGTVVLREHALHTCADLMPGIGGLFVAEQCRCRGIGSALVGAAVAAAGRMNYRVVYAATGTAGALFERLGWERTGDVLHNGEQLAIYRRQVVGHPAAP